MANTPKIRGLDFAVAGLSRPRGCLATRVSLPLHPPADAEVLSVRVISVVDFSPVVIFWVEMLATDPKLAMPTSPRLALPAREARRVQD